MLFQTLDDKKECVGIYYAGELSFEKELSEDLERTWSYSAFLKDADIEYAKLYCGGKTLDNVCPEPLRDRWQAVSNKLKAFIKSFGTSLVSLNESCFFDLVPQKFLLEYCYTKDLICQHVFETYERPSNYDYLLELTKVIEEIKYNKLNLNTKNLSLYRGKHRKFLKKLRTLQPYCKFNIWGTKTGRLTTISKSFPILTMDKEFRTVIEPKNDYFVELDFNAAELRTLLSLQGREQPPEDMHEWNMENVFKGDLTRAEAKKRIFAWLYNPDSHDELCEHAYDRRSILKKHYSHGRVKTIFGKTIESEDRTALNYIIQSTCAENVLRQMIKLSNYLEGYKSYVAFPIHDSVVLDFSAEDKEKLGEIINLFSNTELGKFKVNVSVGTNFGNLQKLEV
ncbi:MAG: DNA polymerase [Vampirovibrionia bacterium]